MTMDRKSEFYIAAGLPFFYVGYKALKLRKDFYDGNWNKDNQRLFETMYSIKPFQLAMDWELDHRNEDYYMSHYNVDYSDVWDPRKMPGVGSTVAGLNYVSDNIRRLYR